MNIEFLKYYVTTVDMANISKAANALYISRQALSKAIHHAEKKLNTKLIDYQGQKLTVTKEGQIFYDNAKAILRLWDSTLQRIEKESFKSTLQVGFGHMSRLIFSSDPAQEFSRQSQIQIIAQKLASDQLVSALFKHELDIIVTNSYVSDPKYVVETLLKRPMYAVVHKDDPIAEKTAITPADLSLKTNIFYTEDHVGAEYFLSLMKYLQLPANLLFCSDSALTTVFSTIAAHNGVFLTSAIFKAVISPAECICIPFYSGVPDSIYNMDVHFIYAKDHPQQTAIKAYQKYLLQHIRQEFLDD